MPSHFLLNKKICFSLLREKIWRHSKCHAAMQDHKICPKLVICPFLIMRMKIVVRLMAARRSIIFRIELLNKRIIM